MKANLKKFFPVLYMVLSLLFGACHNNKDNSTEGRDDSVNVISFEMTTGVIKNKSAAVKVLPSVADEKYYVHLFDKEEYLQYKDNIAKKNV